MVISKDNSLEDLNLRRGFYLELARNSETRIVIKRTLLIVNLVSRTYFI